MARLAQPGQPVPAMPAAPVHLRRVDPGATGDRRAPARDRGWTHDPHCPLSVRDRAGCGHPAVVLPDRRFRLACLLSVLYRITRPGVRMSDDFRDRAMDHRMQDIVLPDAMVGRKARFNLTPRGFPMPGTARCVNLFTRPV